MKTLSVTRQALAALFFIVVSTHAVAQDYKILAQINNIFVDRKADWDKAKKLDYGLHSWSDYTIKQSGNKMIINNKNDHPVSFDQPVNAEREQECWKYTNVKYSASVLLLSDDLAKSNGISIERRNDLSTNTNTSKKTTYGPMDAFYRTFKLLINGKGDVTITKIKKDDLSQVSLFKTDAAKGFLSGAANLLSIERKGLTWNFYLNNELLLTHKDNSFGALSEMYFITDAKSKASFESPSIIYYDNAFMPYERSTSGTTCYQDNECRFKVVEGNIEKQCPSADQNSEYIRYLSSSCYKEDGKLQFGIIFYRNGTKTSDPLSEFLETYVKTLYGEAYNEAAFQSKRVKYLKDSEADMVSQLKSSFSKNRPDATNIAFSGLTNLLVGNNEGRYLDINYTASEASQLRRLFYTYTEKGLMIVQFDAPASGLDGNSVYGQIIKNIYTF